MTISRPGASIESEPNHAVAVGPRGDAVFTWPQYDGTSYRIQARARSADGALSPVQTLSAAGEWAVQVKVAVDRKGNAIFTWTRNDGSDPLPFPTCCRRIQARARSADGALSPVQTLSAAGQEAGGPQVAVDRKGNAIFTWARFDGTNYRVQARARSADGALGPVQTLSPAGQDSSKPQLALDGKGNAIFTWQSWAGPGADYRVQARKRTAAGALGPVQTLSAAGQDSFDPQVGVDGTGDAVFTWNRFDGSDPPPDAYYHIQARARSAAGALSPVQTLSPAGQHSFYPQVGVDGKGNAIFTWERGDNGTYSRVQARRRGAGGALGSILTLSAAGQDAQAPEVAVNDAGDAVFTWQRFDGSDPSPFPYCCERVQARTGSATGALGPVQTLSAAGQDGIDPQLAVNDAGDAVASWLSGKLSEYEYGGEFLIQGAAGP